MEFIHAMPPSKLSRPWDFTSIHLYFLSLSQIRLYFLVSDLSFSSIPKMPALKRLGLDEANKAIIIDTFGYKPDYLS